MLALEAVEPDEVLGANTIAEMMAIDGKLRMMTARRLMAEGVTIFRPETTVIDCRRFGWCGHGDRALSCSFWARPGSGLRLQDSVVFGAGKRGIVGIQVLSSAGMRDCAIADRGRMQALIGPYAHLRPDKPDWPRERTSGILSKRRRFALVKAQRPDHFTYLGDAEIGEKVNVGAGVITCNYDGVLKHTTKIGDGAFSLAAIRRLVAPL